MPVMMGGASVQGGKPDRVSARWEARSSTLLLCTSMVLFLLKMTGDIHRCAAFMAIVAASRSGSSLAGVGLWDCPGAMSYCCHMEGSACARLARGVLNVYVCKCVLHGSPLRGLPKPKA